MDASAWVGVASAVIAVGGAVVAWVGASAARRQADAAEDANRLSREFVSLVVHEAPSGSVHDFVIGNDGNVPAGRVWLRLNHAESDVWRDAPVTIPADEMSPVFTAESIQWPVMAHFDRAPGQIELKRPSRPSRAHIF